MNDLPPRLSKAGTRVVRTGATTTPRALPFGLVRSLFTVTCPCLRFATRQSLTAPSPRRRVLLARRLGKKQGGVHRSKVRLTYGHYYSTIPTMCRLPPWDLTV